MQVEIVAGNHDPDLLSLSLRGGAPRLHPGESGSSGKVAAIRLPGC